MQFQNQDDKTLVMLTLAGEQRAYEALVARYQRTVIASAARITRSQFMAEDAAQDAFVTAWMKLDTLEEQDKYCSWVCRIAKNCALNMIRRYRSFVPVDLAEYGDIADDPRVNPEYKYVASEEENELHTAVSKLSDKVRTIIQLYYFEGLSIVEIADRMRVSQGTVKWQLHDGRKKIRKELCAMNEKWNDTLVERVMKKVEELKLWRLKNNKDGFEVVYKDVLKEVEELPESDKKYHALADVLGSGWWWLNGDKSDEMFAKIKDAAIKGKNEDVMTFIVTREDSQVYGVAKIDFIREKQIPMLEKSGFVQTLGREWFWLGHEYFKHNQTENGYAAFDKVQSILTPKDRYYALVVYAREVEKKMEAGYKAKNKKRFLNDAMADELRIVDGNIRHWSQEEYGEGYMNSIDINTSHLLYNVSRCDGWLFDDKMAVGETKIGSDDTTLTFASENETIHTPCGIFENCQLWITKIFDKYIGYCINKAWYKSGVGIVKFERIVDELSDVRILSKYSIVGGNGLLPMSSGNTWEYADTYNHEMLISELKLTVTHADNESAMVATSDFAERFGYDANSWLDMIQQIRNEYWIYKDKEGMLGDIAIPLERVEALATTPMEKAHSKAALSVVRRIVAGETPNNEYTGHWNFFNKKLIINDNGKIITAQNHRWSFELKRMGAAGQIDTPLLYNDIYGILEDATKCIWSDEWRIGMTPTVEYDNCGSFIKTQINCEDGGTVATKAGTFDNCLKLSMDIYGMNEGWAYRGGKKVYYFANGIGIVRTENEYCDGLKTAVYELTSYEGTGEGYMPMADGLVRRYDALDLTDGYIAGVEYSYVQDDEGNIAIFKDAIGIRKVPPAITQYNSIHAEVIEERLWNEGKHKESRLRHDTNNFHLLCHFLGRDSRYWAAQEKAVAWNKYRLKILEGLGDGTVPDAWLGHYASTCFRTACALFGCEKKDEGYMWLDKAFEAYPKWDNISEGTEMDVGDPLIYGGIKVVKGKDVIKLPDGTMEPISYENLFSGSCNLMYYGMTAPRGWEWFNSVRNEERFKQYIERAKALLNL